MRYAWTSHSAIDIHTHIGVCQTYNIGSFRVKSPKKMKFETVPPPDFDENLHIWSIWPESKICQIIANLAGVTMTLFCTHSRVSGPNSLLGHEVIAPCGYSAPCQF